MVSSYLPDRIFCIAFNNLNSSPFQPCHCQCGSLYHSLLLYVSLNASRLFGPPGLGVGPLFWLQTLESWYRTPQLSRCPSDLSSTSSLSLWLWNDAFSCVFAASPASFELMFCSAREYRASATFNRVTAVWDSAAPQPWYWQKPFFKPFLTSCGASGAFAFVLYSGTDVEC